MVAAAQIHVFDKVDDARYELSAMSDLIHASNVVEDELLDSDVPDEPKNVSACTTDTNSEEGLE